MAAISYKWFSFFSFLFLIPLPKFGATTDTPLRNNLMWHPFYMAVTEIHQNPQDKTLEISCKMFADDFEETLKKNYKVTLDLTAEKDKATLDKLIPDYVSKHLALTVDGKPVRLNYVGFEKDRESAYCYFQVDHVPSVKKLDVNISILYDYSNGQTNIVHAIANGKRQSTKLDYPTQQAGFNF